MTTPCNKECALDRCRSCGYNPKTIGGNVKKIDNLHCGACMKNFDYIEDLNEHLKSCPAALNLLPLVYKLWAGEDNVGHPLSRFIQCCHKEAHLIRRYAHCIADEMDSFHRSKIHAKLCEKLGIRYNDFRPFESSWITEMPNREEAEAILWNALSDYANKVLLKS